MGRRDQDVHFLASKEEVQRIHEKMDELGIRSMGAYLRKMALDGYCINLDLQDVKELVSSFAIGALILYILGCCIYCVFQSLWLQLGLLVGIGLAVYAVLFLFVLFQEIGEHIKENLRDFIFS